MAECPGGRAGRGARSQFRLGDGGFLNRLYPFRGDIMDVGQPSQATAGLSASDFVSPTKGTRTRTVREYEQTINELKKENFDLKLRVYLFEEAINKNRGKDCCSPEKDSTVQVMVQLKLETESLQNELGYKDKLLQEAVDRSEKYAVDIKELEMKCAQLQALLSELPSKDDYVLLLHEREGLLKQNEILEKSIAEKMEEVDEAHQKMEIVSDRSRVLEEKLHKRSLAIQGFVYKNYQEREMLPDELRSVAVTAVQAAKDHNRESLAIAVKSIQAVLSQILSASVPLESEDKENGRSSQAKCLKEEFSEKSRRSLSSQSVMSTDLSHIENLKDLLPTRDVQPNVVCDSVAKGKMVVESSQNLGEKDIVDLMDFSVIPSLIMEETNISATDAARTQQGYLGGSGVINIENIFSPTVSPVSSHYKDASTSVSSHHYNDASISVSCQNEDKAISVSPYQCKDASTSASYQNKDASTSASYQCKDASVSASYQSEDKSISVSPYQYKDASTSVSYQCKDASTSASFQNKDASTSASFQNKDASVSVSSCQYKDVSTSDSLCQNRDAPISDSSCQINGASVSVSSYEYKDASTPVSSYDCQDTSTSVPPCQNKNASTSVPLLNIKDASTSYEKASTSPTRNASTSVSLHEIKHASTSYERASSSPAGSSSHSPSLQLQKLLTENNQLRQKLEEKRVAIENLTTSKPMTSCWIQTEDIQASPCTDADVQTDTIGPPRYEVVESEDNLELSREDRETVLNEDGRSELHERLAFSCAVNVELMRHLHNLEQFMENLLHHRLDSSLENISDRSSIFANLSRCLNESLKLSSVLSDHLSICEGSKLFEECKSMLYGSTASFSDEKSLPQLDFSELNLPDLPLASDPRCGPHHPPPPPRLHPSYPSSDSDIWSEPDRDVSMQRIGIDLQYSPASAKSPRKFKWKERRTAGRWTTDHHNNTSSSEMRPGSKHPRRNGSACRRLFGRPEEFPVEKYHSILAEKFSNLESLLSRLENIEDEEISTRTRSQMNSLMSSLGEALQKLQTTREYAISSSSTICGKCALLELLTTLRTSSGDFDDQPMASCQSEILHQFQTEISQMTEICKEPFPLFATEVCEPSQSSPSVKTEREKIDELEQVVLDFNRRNEKLMKRSDKVQNLLGHERNMMESVKAENLLLSNDVNHLKEEVLKLNNINEKLVKDFDEVKNLLSQERNLLESVKAENILLSNEVNRLKEEVLDLQQKENLLSLQNSELNEKLGTLGKNNSDLNDILSVLEQKKNESDVVLDQLSAELQKNKSELVGMTQKCVELEKELSEQTEMKEEFTEKFRSLQSSSSVEKEMYLNEIENLNVERNNFLEKLESVQREIIALENEKSRLNDTLNARDDELNSLLKTIEQLQSDKEALSTSCAKLQSSLDSEKEQCLTLQERCHSYDEEMSKKLAAFQAYYRELQQVEAKFLSEKTEHVDKISRLISEKDDIWQKFNSQKEHSEKLMAEKMELEQKLVESVQQISSLQLSDGEKKELVNEISLLTSEREDILQKINRVKEHSEKLTTEKMELNQKLLNRDKEITSLRRSNDELERAHSSLLQKNEQIQSVLLSSDSNCAVLGNDLKHMRETVLNLESKCAAYEKELVASAGMKDYVVECLLSIRGEFMTVRQEMTEMCKSYDGEDLVECDETPALDFVPIIDGHNVTALCDLVSSESKRLLKTVDVLLGILRRSQLKSHKMHSVEERHSKKIASVEKQVEMQKHEIEHLKSQNSHLQKMIEEKQKSMSENEKSVTFSAMKIQSLKEQFQNSENEVEKRKLLLKMKEDEITMLQERVFNLQTYINSMLVETNDSFRKTSRDVVEKSVQADSILPNNSLPTPATVIPTVDKGCQKDGVGVEEHSASAESSSSFKASCCERYRNKCRSLQRRLALFQKRIEILEEEKEGLREFQASHSNSLEARESASVKMADLESKLEQRKAFVAELKAELMKVCNSLIDKERELDNLKMKVSEYETKLKWTLPDTSEQSLMAKPKTVDANITNLRKYKWKLIQTIFDIQRNFYQKKGIHLNHFDNFKERVDALYSLKLVQHPLSKSESLPLLESHSTVQLHGDSDHRMKDMMGLELDIECLENLKIFLSRFCVPSVLQQIVQTECSPKSFDLASQVAPTDLASESSHLASQVVQTDPALRATFTSQVAQTERTPKSSHVAQTECSRTSPSYVDQSHSVPPGVRAHHVELPGKPELEAGSLETLQREKAQCLEFFEGEDILEKYYSTENFALNVSRYLDFMENFFKAVRRYKKWNSLDDSAADGETEAKSLLLKIVREIKMLSKRAEGMFRLNTMLKSLDLFTPQTSKTPDVSDRESVMSEETITISRSDTPASIEDLCLADLPYSPTDKAEENIAKTTHSPKGRGTVTEPKMRGSFESVHHRSQYSSPDLGIESDPNHESSVPEQKDNEVGIKYQKLEDRKSAVKQQPKISLTTPETMGKWKGILFSGGGSLYSVGHLPHYELLKREIQESLVGIKSVLSRTGDGLRHIASYTSPRKTLEYSTMRAIKDSCVHVEVCLKEAYRLVGKFWTAPCPTEEDWNHLVQENQKLSDQLSKLRVLMHNQETEFKKAMGKLEQAELLKANMEKKISKKLVKTKKVIRQAELKLLEKGCQNCPPVPKHLTEPETG